MKRKTALTLIIATMITIGWRSTSAQQHTAVTALPLPNIAANGSLRLQADVPLANATVGRPIQVGGWALDL
jgi:hypothetical protein